MSETSFVIDNNFIQIQTLNQSDKEKLIGVYIYEVLANTVIIDRYIEGLLFKFNELDQYVYISDKYVEQKYYVTNLIKNNICYIEDNKLFLTDSTLLKLI